MRQEMRDLARIFAADLILRWAYQMGKSPLLPLFAALLGAAEMMTGLIVSVSTFTGMMLKPLFGMLSDRWGRRLWLLVALGLFTVMPFLYRFVETPEQLFALRLIHGLATAIFGPVSLSFVAELNAKNRATRLAVFGMARSVASLGAPICAGFALTFLEIETVFTLIGFLSLTAALPLLTLREHVDNKHHFGIGLRQQFITAFRHSIQTPAIWLAGMLELMVYLVTYAIKAFLPLFILSQEGGTILQAGLFFTVQEAVHIAIRTFGGRLADRRGYGVSILGGLFFMTIGVGLLPVFSGLNILISACLLGVTQGLIFPASLALLAGGTRPGFRGFGMGFYGALRNTGKVIGPVIAGTLLAGFGFSAVFSGFAIAIGFAAVGGGIWMRLRGFNPPTP